MSKDKKNRGITLIALTITMIVLLVLTGVMINLTNKGIIKKAKYSADKYSNTYKDEKKALGIYYEQMSNEINEKTNFPINKEGEYYFIVNAGTKAKWLYMQKYGESIPDGSSITYKFYTSNDKENWNEYASIAEINEYTQYLKVLVTLKSNESGQTPKIDGILVRFKNIEDIEIIDNPDSDTDIYNGVYNIGNMNTTDSKNIQKLSEGYGLASGEDEGIVVQQMKLKNKMLSKEILSSIDVPIINYGNDNENTDNIRTSIYVSNDGNTWSQASDYDTTQYSYVKTETIIKRNNGKTPIIGIASINPQELNVTDVSTTWYDQEERYYYSQMENEAEWFDVIKEEEIPEGTRIRYLYSKSNDGKNWSDYSESIKANNNSKYVRVRVTFQTNIKDGKKIAKLNYIEIVAKVNNKKYYIYPSNNINSVDKDNKSDKGLVQVFSLIDENAIINFKIKDEEYSADCITHKGNLVLDGNKTIDGVSLSNNTYEVGDESDCATQTEYAKNMVILKVDGDLTINNGVTLTACKSSKGYGGPKGLLIYCTGKLTNNGTISMTARGAKAEGQNVYLFQNKDGSYEYVPKEGGAGGTNVSNSWNYVSGLPGNNRN